MLIYYFYCSSLCFLHFFLYFFSFQRHGHHRYLHSFPHDALPIFIMDSLLRRLAGWRCFVGRRPCPARRRVRLLGATSARRKAELDRKSTRLNSSHLVISYAVFCLKKKK